MTVAREMSVLNVLVLQAHGLHRERAGITMPGLHHLLEVRSAHKLQGRVGGIEVRSQSQQLPHHLPLGGLSGHGLNSN